MTAIPPDIDTIPPDIDTIPPDIASVRPFPPGKNPRRSLSGDKQSDHVTLRSRQQPGRVRFQQGTLKAAHSGSSRRGCYSIFFPGVTLATRGSNRRGGKGPCRWGNTVYLMGRSCVYMMVRRWGNAVYRMAPFQAQERPSAIFVRG